MTLFALLRTVVTRPRRGEAVAARRALRALDLERVRYPGEDEAATRMRRIKGFRKQLQVAERELALHPRRRPNLDESLRLDRGTAPAVFEALGEVREALGFEGELEVYQCDGQINAAMASTEGGAMLTFQGPLLEILSGRELRGLIGHELAHYICHSGPSARHRAETRVSLDWRDQYDVSDHERLQRLSACALSVAQEITADRIELLINQDLDTYLCTTLKFSTELHDAVIRHDPAVLLRQSREALESNVGAIDRLSTHPERPLRVRAAELFFESDLFRELTGQGTGARPLAEVNAEVASLLTGWVPRGADRIDQERFEQFLLATATAIVAADGVFRQDERRFLARTLPRAWRGRLPDEREAEALVESFARELREQGDQRALLTALNFLCGLVEADGRVGDEELRAIDVVGRALGARELFRHELAARFEFEPGRERLERGAMEDAVSGASPSLLRYLDSVVVAGQRRSSLGRLLQLGGHGARTPEALRRLGAVLEASGVVPSEPLASVAVKAPLVLRRSEDAEEAPPSGALRARSARGSTGRRRGRSA